MKASQLRRILREGRKMKCSKCPIPQRTCSALSKGLWGEERCLLRIVLKEVLVFHTEEHKPGAGKRLDISTSELLK